jgi:hypothetical protein
LNGSERLVGRVTVAVDSHVVVTREERASAVASDRE